MSTIYSRSRIVLRKMGTARRPGTIAAIINDPMNMGVSEYLNGPGELYFTLRATHPQIGACEPWQTHYDVQEWINGVWKSRFRGILSDFDANENDIIVYGIDYLGLLDKVIDTRYVEGSPDQPVTAVPPGSKYVNQYISTCIRDIIDYARYKPSSPVQWIERGAFNTFAEKVTIFSTFSSIREFISGLVDSHKAGTGHRSRFWVERISDTRARFRLADNVGVDRPGMAFTYGGMVQGFQIIGYGDFGVRAHGIGRTQVGSKLHYKTGTAPGMNLATWGSIETVAFHDNVVDANDLARRVNLHAAQSGRIGKRAALGLKVEGIRPFEGYGMGDNFKVLIKRGAIDTSRFGSGYWTLNGVEWRVFPDGHDEVTLVVLPKEDKIGPQTDILVAQEVLPPDPAVAPGSITSDKLADGAVTTVKIADQAVTTLQIADGAVDTAQIALAAVDTAQIADGAVTLDQIEPGSLDASVFAPGTLPTVDVTAPAVPTALALSSEVAVDADGHHILRLIADLNQPADSDLYGSWVEVTNKNDGAVPPNPDWDYPQVLFVPATLSSVAVEGVVGNTQYWARAQAADRAGNRSAYTSVVSHVSLRDTEAPPQPDSLTVVAGFKGFAATWPASTAPDLMFNEVRWAVDDGTGLAPDINNWSLMRARASTVFISGLVAEQQYWVQVRSVDLSGNVVTSTADPTAVDYLANGDAGWVAAVSVTPTLIGSNDIAAESVTAVHIAAGSLTADDIRAGTLVISPDAAFADGIEVRDASDNLLGRWDETGLKIIDPTDASRYILVDSGQVKLTTNGGATFDAAITPDGINASSINFGAAPGGHNLLQNSSFELADFAPAPTVFTFTDTTQWKAAARLVAPQNLLEGTALTVQTPGYV